MQNKSKLLPCSIFDFSNKANDIDEFIAAFGTNNLKIIDNLFKASYDEFLASSSSIINSSIQLLLLIHWKSCIICLVKSKSSTFVSVPFRYIIGLGALNEDDVLVIDTLLDIMFTAVLLGNSLRKTKAVSLLLQYPFFRNVLNKIHSKKRCGLLQCLLTNSINDEECFLLHGLQSSRFGGHIVSKDMELIPILRLLLASGLSTNCSFNTDSNGLIIDNSFAYCAYRGYLETLKLLLTWNSTVPTIDKISRCYNGVSYDYCGTIFKSNPIIAAIVSYSTLCKITTILNMSDITSLDCMKSKELLDYLLVNSGFRKLINYIDCNFNTPLLVACQCKNKDIVNLLLMHGANPWLRIEFHKVGYKDQASLVNPINAELKGIVGGIVTASNILDGQDSLNTQQTISNDVQKFIDLFQRMLILVKVIWEMYYLFNYYLKNNKYQM